MLPLLMQLSSVTCFFGADTLVFSCKIELLFCPQMAIQGFPYVDQISGV